MMVTEIMKIMAMGDNYEYGNGGWHNFAAVVNMAMLVNMLAVLAWEIFGQQVRSGQDCNTGHIIK